MQVPIATNHSKQLHYCQSNIIVKATIKTKAQELQPVYQHYRFDKRTSEAYINTGEQSTAY